MQGVYRSHVSECVDRHSVSSVAEQQLPRSHALIQFFKPEVCAIDISEHNLARSCSGVGGPVICIASVSLFGLTTVSLPFAVMLAFCESSWRVSLELAIVKFPVVLLSRLTMVALLSSNPVSLVSSSCNIKQGE